MSITKKNNAFPPPHWLNSEPNGLDDFFWPEAFEPVVQANIYEEDDRYVAEIVVPGIPRDALQVLRDHRSLMIQGNYIASADSERTYLRQEFMYTNFCRVIFLPKDADLNWIKAHYCNGILHVHIPKAEKTLDTLVAINVQ